MPPIPPMPGIPPARITTSRLKRENKWRLLRHQDFSFDFSKKIITLPSSAPPSSSDSSSSFQREKSIWRWSGLMSLFSNYWLIQYLFGNIVQMENLEPVGLGLVLEKALPVRSFLGLSKGKAISRAFNMILGNVFWPYLLNCHIYALTFGFELDSFCVNLWAQVKCQPSSLVPIWSQ